MKILLAEDSADSEALVKLYLSLEGATCDVAHDGVEAVEKAPTSDYDAILMDVQMPRMDGLEATRKLRAHHYGKPIIALTAHALQTEIRKSMEAGCNAHLTKPISREKLVEALIAVTSQPRVPETTTMSEPQVWFSV